VSVPGTPERPLMVAIVGSGPSGFYAANALLTEPGLAVRVDIFDRLPTPFGLVRGGVAPDHQRIKSVVAVYEKLAQDPRVRFFGNVKLGEKLLVDDLRARYDQIVYAVGTEGDRRMGIPGEELEGSFSAAEFVGWYNGHPDHRDRRFDFSGEAAAVVGMGNVAIDVARILTQDPEVLAKTDIASYAIEALRRSNLKRVHLLGRRGPLQAAFSTRELEELGKVADLIVRPEELEVSLEGASDAAAKTLASLKAFAARPASHDRQVVLRFLVSPVEVLGSSGNVSALRLERNLLDGSSARGTGELTTLPGVGLVFRSIGYRGIPIPGVPFDETAGHVANDAGRVTFGGKIVRGEYVVGWAKRGPSGLIGTNRPDSSATVQAMLNDLREGKLDARPVDSALESMPRLLARRGARPVTYAQWKRLDEQELLNGLTKGKIREKFSSVSEMLSALGEAA
jgi:ferredoxin--NADP+ reductase